MRYPKEPAYSELYIHDAQKTIAHSFDYAVKKIGFSLEQYAMNFAYFKYIDLIENGDPHYLCGMSGIELSREICNINERLGRIPYNPQLEYWTGWILCYYQWCRNISYKDILAKFSIADFRAAFPTFHECNKTKMIEYMDEKIFGVIYE